MRRFTGLKRRPIDAGRLPRAVFPRGQLVGDFRKLPNFRCGVITSTYSPATLFCYCFYSPPLYRRKENDAMPPRAPDRHGREYLCRIFRRRDGRKQRRHHLQRARKRVGAARRNAYGLQQGTPIHEIIWPSPRARAARDDIRACSP